MYMILDKLFYSCIPPQKTLDTVTSRVVTKTQTFTLKFKFWLGKGEHIANREGLVHSNQRMRH